MSVSLISLIESAQQRYTAYFTDAVERAKAENPDVVSEFLIPLSDDAIPYPYRFFRADLMGEDEEDNTQAIELWQNPPADDDENDNAPAGQSMAEAQSYAFDLGHVVVEIHPITWCGVQISFDHMLSDESVITEYLDEWFDPEDRAYDSGAPFAEALHSATQIIEASAPENDKRPSSGRSTDLYAPDAPDESAVISTITIDYGTAPAEALLDLVERLALDGATHIVLMSEARGD